MKREMSVNGSFYPDDKAELLRYFKHFEKTYDEKSNLPDVNTKAVIVPHAGYIYSGFSASIAYRVLGLSEIKKFVVIGPSHKVAYEGISLGDFESYETPLGDIKYIQALHTKLKDEFDLKFIEAAHKEHSTEVQFPFLKHYIDDVELLELVYSKYDAKNISEIINFILQDKEYGVIISTDLSHFYTQEDAHKLDNICLDAISNLDISKLHSGCEACGITGVQAMMLSAKKLSLSPNILDYRTSADASGNTIRVVGYMSAYFK